VRRRAPLTRRSKAQAALLALSKTCLSLTIPSHLRLSASALYHHAALQFTRPGLLENVRSASGKFEPDLTKESSIEWLRDWVKNSQEVRKVMWHAAVLNALLGEFSKGCVAWHSSASLTAANSPSSTGLSTVHWCCGR
jgi:hypothetical protein